MKLLVTGANGFIGTHLCAILRMRDVPLVQIVRTACQPEHIAVGDLADYNNWASLLEGVTHILHLAGLAHQGSADDDAYIRANVRATQRLVDACAAHATPPRLLLMSSVAVCGTSSGNTPFTCEDTSPQGAYAQSKAMAEQVVRDSALRSTIIRIPLVYGAHVKANMLQLLSLIYRGVPLPFGLIQNTRSLCAVENLCDAIYHIIVHDASADYQTLHIADAQTLSTPSLIRHMADGMQRPARLLPVPPVLLKTGFAAMGKSALYQKLCGNLAMECAASNARLGWQPPIEVSQGLRAMAQWYKQEQSLTINNGSIINETSLR